MAFIAIPWMLLAKPYYLQWEHNKHRVEGYVNLSHENLNGEVSPSMDVDRSDMQLNTGTEEMNHEEVNSEVTPQLLGLRAN
jgi:hypothetical protein